jgi:hypothetical protein
LNFSWGKSEASIGLMMNYGHADGAVRVVIAVIMVMERCTQKGEEQETDKE